MRPSVGGWLSDDGPACACARATLSAACRAAVVKVWRTDRVEPIEGVHEGQGLFQGGDGLLGHAAQESHADRGDLVQLLLSLDGPVRGRGCRGESRRGSLS